MTCETPAPVIIDLVEGWRLSLPWRKTWSESTSSSKSACTRKSSCSRCISNTEGVQGMGSKDTTRCNEGGFRLLQNCSELREEACIVYVAYYLLRSWVRDFYTLRLTPITLPRLPWGNLVNKHLQPSSLSSSKEEYLDTSRISALFVRLAEARGEGGYTPCGFTILVDIDLKSALLVV